MGDNDIPCQHLNFKAQVDVARLADDDRPLRFMAEIGIECADCGTVFEFVGVDVKGISFHSPSTGIFDYPMSVPIRPAETQPKVPYMTEELNRRRP